MGTDTGISVTIRPARIDDLPRLTEIYNHYVVNTPTTFDLEPFSVEQRAQWFARYGTVGRYRLLVAEGERGILGYTSSSPFHPRRAYDTTVETTILCAPEAIGRGIGRRLYEALFEALRARTYAHRRADYASERRLCALHERCGFAPATVLVKSAGSSASTGTSRGTRACSGTDDGRDDPAGAYR
jgi:phosphinothricin acetyltransferase